MEPTPTFVLVPPEQAANFAPLTFPACRPLLGTFTSVAVAVLEGEQTVGFGLARIHTPSHAELMSALILPAHTGRGLGTLLVQSVEELLAERGCRTVETICNTELPGTPPFLRVLQKRGWSEPRRRMLCVRMDRRLLESKWFQEVALPAAYVPFLWTTLSPDEIRQAEAMRAEVPAGLWPFEDEESIDPFISLGLRRGPELIGWIIAHRVDEDTVRYTTLFVREPRRSLRAALFFGLLAEAVRRRYSRPTGPNAGATFAVRADNEPMVRIAMRRLIPVGRGWSELLVSEKQLRG